MTQLDNFLKVANWTLRTFFFMHPFLKTTVKRGYKVIKTGLHKSLVMQTGVSTWVLTRHFGVQDRVRWAWRGVPGDTRCALVLGPRDRLLG